MNKYGLGRHSTGFLILNKKLPLKSGKLTTVGPEVINIRVMQAGKSLAITLQTHSQHASDVINPSAFQLSTPI